MQYAGTAVASRRRPKTDSRAEPHAPCRISPGFHANAGARAIRKSAELPLARRSRAFFKDLRASQVGDILTVTVSITDTVDLDNKIERTRTNSEGATLPNFLGYEQALNAIFPETVTPATLVNGTSNSSILGDGKIDRTDKVNTKVAAIVVQVLPNGNLVIEGRQETRVNAEVRELAITGIVRPQDITTSNTINYEQVAEARLAYGGRGILTDVQRPRYGQEIYDILFPF